MPDVAIVADNETLLKVVAAGMDIGALPDGRRISSRALAGMSLPGNLSAQPVVAAPEPPDDKVVSGSVVQRVNGAWTEVQTLADAPPPRVPRQVDMARAKIALDEAGLLDAVETTLAGIADPTTKRRAEIAWSSSPTISRNGALVTTLAAAVPLTDAQLDALFLAAAAIEL